MLYANRIEVVDAAIYSRAAGRRRASRAEALDVFRVRDSMGRPVTDEARWTQGARGSRGRAVGADQGGDAGRRRARAPTRSPPGRRRRCRPSCKIDNDVSRDFTVVEVITEDRPGVLYAITRTLFVAGLDIHRSKIATEANRAIDVFYVRDKATMEKITDPERQASLRETLLASAAPGVDATKLRGQRLAHRERCRCRRRS